MRTTFKQYLIVLALLTLPLTGCGYNPDKPVYDTKANPDNFPQASLTLLDNVESGLLNDYSTISEAFGELYMNNPNLLDNDKWQNVINTLGIKFRFKAEQMVEKGVEYYTRARGFYTLASFARPNDEQLKKLSRLFSVWQENVEDTSLSIYKEVKLKQNLIYQLKRVKRYVFGDSLQKVFARNYLIEQVISPLLKDNPGEKENLSVADQAFLSTMELGKLSDEMKPLVKFNEPNCDLIAYELFKNGQDSYKIVLYFIPEEKINEELNISFRIDTHYTDMPVDHEQRTGEHPFDFIPENSSNTWQPRQVNAIWYDFTFQGPINAFFVGLYYIIDGEAIHVDIADTDENMKRLPVVKGH